MEYEQSKTDGEEYPHPWLYLIKVFLFHFSLSVLITVNAFDTI
jgi:hypothetical protein